MNEGIKIYLGRIMLVVLICVALIFAVLYLNSRWAKIRDIRRQADAQSIIKALDFYNIQIGYYPKNDENDGDGWDKSNDLARSFLNPLSDLGLISSLIFDPKNDETHYYRYQKFSAGVFGCRKPFAVFQVTNFETDIPNLGQGTCPEFNWVKLAPHGFTWFGLD